MEPDQMLRFIAFALLLVNGVYFAWTQGWLRDAGLAPTVQTEPQRLAQQVKPESLRILSPEEVRRVETLVSKVSAPECLEAGLFDEKQSATLRRSLVEVLPAGSWSLQPNVLPGRWLVYMGKFASAEVSNRKKAELKAKGVTFEPLRNPKLEPGISLGGYDTQAGANQGLKELAQKGVRTALVVQERPEQRGDLLRLPAVDDKIRAGVEGIREALGDKSLHVCAK
jgi:hypothetical protein